MRIVANVVTLLPPVIIAFIIAGTVPVAQFLASGWTAVPVLDLDLLLA
jgi:hypothetical protein